MEKGLKKAKEVNIPNCTYISLPAAALLCSLLAPLPNCRAPRERERERERERGIIDDFRFLVQYISLFRLISLVSVRLFYLLAMVMNCSTRLLSVSSVRLRFASFSSSASSATVRSRSRSRSRRSGVLRFKSLKHYLRTKHALENQQVAQAVAGQGYAMKRLLGKGAYGTVFLCERLTEAAELETAISPSPQSTASAQRAIKVLNLQEARKEYDFTWLTAEERLRADEEMKKLLGVLETMPEGVVKDHFLRSHTILLDKLVKEADPRLRRTRRPVAEQEILQKCTGHPFVNSLKASFRDHTHLYLVFGYFSGGSLQELLERSGGVFAEDVARFYASQLILGLEFLYEKNIAHRDIKPSNLLLTAKGNLVICDFGLATRLKGGLKTFCGTADYIAPEVLSEKTWPSSYLDYWAFGVTLYEMLTGRTPFADSSAHAVFLNTLTQNLTFPPHVSPEAQSFLRMVLERDRSKRPGPEEIKAHPFFDGVDWDDALALRLSCPVDAALLRRGDGGDKKKPLREHRSSSGSFDIE